MTPALVISNPSPLIGREHLGHLDLLEKLFGAVIIPPDLVVDDAGKDIKNYSNA